MTRFDGSTALKFAVGAVTTTDAVARRRRAGLRLVVSGRELRRLAKYQVLEHRRRQAQIKARHLLNLMEEAR